MDQIQIANILLTRRCNLRCDYCAIVRDYSDIPPEYPRMEHYKQSEIDADQWIIILNRLKKNNPDVFIIFYGGEPFLYEDLYKLIDHCHKEDIAYTIISNNTPQIQPKIIELYEKVGPIKGFTASIDPDLAKYKHLLLDRETTMKGSVLKTLEGFRNLNNLNSSEMVKDVVAEITVMPDNVKYLYETVKLLSDCGIFSSITTIDMKKSPYYDFSTVDDVECRITRGDDIAAEFFKILADKNLKVHIPEMLLDLYNVLPWDMWCDIYEDIHNVTIDADGRFRLCLRIRGINTQNLKLDSVIDSEGRIEPFFKKSMEKDYKGSCQGCNWTCMLMSGLFSKNIIKH